MNSLSLILGYILFFSLFVWVFISNDFYLKVYFLKSKKKYYRKLSENDTDKFFYEQAYGGRKAPKYIKDSISKSQDKHQLLALYLASENITDIGLYNKITTDSSLDIYKECAKYISKAKHVSFNIVLNFLRFLAVLAFWWLLYIFLSHVFFDVNSKIQSNDQFIMVSIICVSTLMPYRIYSKYIFLNRLYALSSFMCSMVLSFFIMYYFYGYSGYFIFNKDAFSIVLSSLIILQGAHSYIGYMKLEYLVRFFELLKVNLVQNNDDK
ncbi:hypothetical protein [Acinetobacter junii]|uniref:hypothetical protein n=1 Tax=Acinetobacter junii TaxID=40215 RepID=UPI003018B1D9